MLRLSWVLFDLVCLLLSGYLSHHFYFAYVYWIQRSRVHAPLWAAIMAGVGIFVNYLLELYDPQTQRDSSKLTVRLLMATGTTGILVILLNYSVFYPGVGRVILTLSLLGALFGEILWRWIHTSLYVKAARERTLVVGDGEFAKELCFLLMQNHPYYPYTLSGIVTSNGQIKGLQEVPRIGWSELGEAIVRHRVSSILLVPDPAMDRQYLDSLVNCLKLGVRFEDGQVFYERVTGRVPVPYIDQTWFLSHVRSLGGVTFRRAKRGLDFCGALVGILVAFPFALVIGLLIKLTGPGPIFYRQRRVGLNGEVFELIKFRTMVVGAEKEGPVWASLNDQRVTKFGRILRRTRLDELPQLWNILLGEMSFVGPRPERPEFVDALRKQIPFYWQRHLVRPGLTGWAQVRCAYGASAEDAQRKLEYDLFYIKNQSILSDLLVLGKTISVVMGRKGSR